MDKVMAKFEKEFIRNIFIEVSSDFIMIVIGLITGYFLKIWLM